jgi:pimeloyl-ACP methyl ester carboxylesterase
VTEKSGKYRSYKILTYLTGFMIVLILLLLFFQRSMIYMPVKMNRDHIRSLSQRYIPIEFKTTRGMQAAFYIKPSSHPLDDPSFDRTPPETLWVLFNGNAALAVHWDEFIMANPDQEAGYLLVEYPGYGYNEGKPTRQSIHEGSCGAIDGLFRTWDVRPGEQQFTLGFMGYSLGAAAALDLTEYVRPDRIILLAPFTRMLDMARRTVGWPLCHVLIDRFNNVRHLEILYAGEDKPDIAIFHGTGDTIVPTRMGKDLADPYPNMVSFYPVSGAGHNDLLYTARHQLYRVMGDSHKHSNPDKSISAP